MAQGMLTLEQRLERTENRAEIADLVHGYARAVRHGRPEEAAALFVKDGWFEICEGLPGEPLRRRVLLEGRDHYLVYLQSTAGKAPPVSPMIHNLIVVFDGPDTAHGNAVLDVMTLTTGQRITGEYNDTYRREDGRWFFVGRQFIIQADRKPL